MTCGVGPLYPVGMASDVTSLNAGPMTTIQVPLSDAAQQQLRQRAVERGVPLEVYARTVLEREAAAPAPDAAADQWIAE